MGSWPGSLKGYKSLLLSVRVDFLTKISLLVEQTYANHRDAQIARCLELIAGNVPEPARINRQGLTQHELHGEVCNRRESRNEDALFETSLPELSAACLLAMEISEQRLETPDQW